MPNNPPESPKAIPTTCHFLYKYYSIYDMIINFGSDLNINTPDTFVEVMRIDSLSKNQNGHISVAVCIYLLKSGKTVLL